MRNVWDPVGGAPGGLQGDRKVGFLSEIGSLERWQGMRLFRKTAPDADLRNYIFAAGGENSRENDQMATLRPPVGPASFL